MTRHIGPGLQRSRRCHDNVEHQVAKDDDAVITARLHPDDVASLGAAPEAVAVIAAPAIEPGGCILEVGDSRIDAQLGSALD